MFKWFHVNLDDNINFDYVHLQFGIQNFVYKKNVQYEKVFATK